MKKNTWLTDCIWLALGMGFIYAFFLGTRPLNTPDEARYSEIPREMVANGHYLIPHLNGIKYFEKPDLFYWLQSLSVKFLGLSEWAMRFWPAAFGILSAVIVYLAARKLYSRRAGLYAAIILGTSLLHYALSHLISIDMAVSFFISASLLSFLVAINTSIGRKRRVFIYLAAVSAACAVLTKGLIGLAFPGLIVFTWLLVTNQWKLLTKVYFLSALLLFLVVTLPWHLMMAFAQPHWAHFYFINQQFARYATPIAARPGPIWFFLAVLLVGFFPWTVFLPQAIKHSWPRWKHRLSHQNDVYLLLWAGIILIFFSLSQSKLIPYILPTMPPLAMLMGKYLASIGNNNLEKPQLSSPYQGRKMKRTFFFHYLVIQVMSILFALALLITPHFDSLPDKHVTYLVATLCSILLLFGPFLAYWRCKQHESDKRATHFFIGLAIYMAILLPILNLASTYYYNNSTKPLAEVVRPLLKPNDIAIDYGHYYQDLPFYLRRRVVLTRLADELQFGAALQRMKDWVWNEATITKRWQQPQEGRLFVFMSRGDYRDFKQRHPNLNIYPIASTSQNIVISNQENTP